MPSASPALIWKSTPSTARTSPTRRLKTKPPLIGKYFWSPLTSSSGPPKAGGGVGTLSRVVCSLIAGYLDSWTVQPRLDLLDEDVTLLVRCEMAGRRPSGRQQRPLGHAPVAGHL